MDKNSKKALSHPLWKRGDFFLLLGALLLAAILFALFILFRTEGARAVVTLDGAEYGSYPLSEDRTVEIRQADGTVTNRLIIQDGRARMEWAACPDQICIEQGEISRQGQSIVCLPGRVAVEITGGEESGPDAVVQ